MGNASCGGGGFGLCSRFGRLRVRGFWFCWGCEGLLLCVFLFLLIRSINASGLLKVFYVLWRRFRPRRTWLAFSCCSASKMSKAFVSSTVLRVSQVSSLGEYPRQRTKYWIPRPVPRLVRMLSTSHSSSPSMITGPGLASSSPGCVWYGSSRETWKTGCI